MRQQPLDHREVLGIPSDPHRKTPRANAMGALGDIQVVVCDSNFRGLGKLVFQDTFVYGRVVLTKSSLKDTIEERNAAACCRRLERDKHRQIQQGIEKVSHVVERRHRWRSRAKDACDRRKKWWLVACHLHSFCRIVTSALQLHREWRLGCSLSIPALLSTTAMRLQLRFAVHCASNTWTTCILHGYRQ